MQTAESFRFSLITDQAPCLPESLMSVCTLAPEPGGRGMSKWLKRQSETPVVLMQVRQVDHEVLDLLDYFRVRVGNRDTRLICFVPHHAMSQLQHMVASHQIHRLQSMDDWNEDFLTELIEAEHNVFRNQADLRGNRTVEIELMTWLARISRRAHMKESDRPDLLALVGRLMGADIAILADAEGNQQHCLQLEQNGDHPQESDSNNLWQPVLEQLTLKDDDQRPMRIELNPSHPAHQQAAMISGLPVCASLYLPLRCYKQTQGGLLLLMANDRLAHMEVGLINMLEKVMDQLRGTLERQQAEASLQQQYERLQETIKSLHQTQEQLYHAEKLSSIGQLAAGIAHEINNPIAFVLSNFEPLDDYIQDMTQLLRMHDQFLQSLDPACTQKTQPKNSQGNSAAPGAEEASNKVVHLRQAHRDTDLDFILGDINALVNESRSGLKRVCDIVTSLSSFARKDGPETEISDLVRCFNDSLTIIQSTIGQNIQVRTQLPDNAEARFNPGQMGQVFVNLLQNACQAMPNGGELRCRIEMLDNGWQIDIEDTGAGIPESIQSKIFDPFFTTKPVGQGTGLGLSTVYSIVNRHKGHIQVISREGEGSCFRIQLPGNGPQGFSEGP